MQRGETGVHSQLPRRRPHSAKRESALLLPAITPFLRSAVQFRQELAATQEELVEARGLLVNEQQQHSLTRSSLQLHINS